MKKITILALRGAEASSITCPMDVFQFTGVLWNYIREEKVTPCFEVTVASPDGRPVACFNRLNIEPHCGMNDIKSTDIIIISAVTGDILKSIEKNGEVIAWLKKKYKEGTQIASICTSAFLLAETGLLNGKTATTHWGFINFFQKRYPLIDVCPDAMVTDAGDIYTSGGSHAFCDLSYYLLEKFTSREIAIKTAKALVMDFGRPTQAPYVVYNFPKAHNEANILAIQRWIEENYKKEITIPTLAEQFGMSQRTLQRRFKQTTGDSPLVYLQKVRINAAKSLLEEPYATFEDVTYRVGYEDISSFRKIFQRHTGLRPKEYQRLFQ